MFSPNVFCFVEQLKETSRRIWGAFLARKLKRECILCQFWLFFWLTTFHLLQLGLVWVFRICASSKTKITGVKRHPDHSLEQTTEPLTKEGWSQHRTTETMVQSVFFFFFFFFIFHTLGPTTGSSGRILSEVKKGKPAQKKMRHSSTLVLHTKLMHLVVMPL